MPIRERDVSARLATGAGNQVIGGDLGISQFTVKCQVQNIFRRLGIRPCHSVGAFYTAGFEAIRYARDADIVGTLARHGTIA